MGELVNLATPDNSPPIPDAALDDRLGWVGTAGSGKTYNAGGGVERLLEAGARVVIVDPLDVWWGLARSFRRSWNKSCAVAACAASSPG